MEKHQIDFDELGVSELVEMLEHGRNQGSPPELREADRGGTQDPVIYFYEDFLQDYGEEQRISAAGSIPRSRSSPTSSAP